MEVLFEFIFEVYLGLMLMAVPEHKKESKKIRVIVGIIAITVLLSVLALFVLGIALIEDRSPWGWLWIGLSIVISLAQIFAGFIISEKKGKK